MWHIRPTADHDTHGYIEHELVIGGIKCTHCGVSASGRRILAACPEPIKPLLVQADGLPIDAALLAEINRLWRLQDKAPTAPQKLLGGDIFGPAHWRERPTAKGCIFWPMNCLCATKINLAELFMAACLSGLGVLPISRSDGEIDETVEWVVEEHTAYRYWEEDGNRVTECDECGRTVFNESHANRAATTRHRREKTLPNRFIGKTDIFRSHIFYPGFVVSDRAFELLQFADLLHCCVEQITVA